jgi:hypothetical protein
VNQLAKINVGIKIIIAVRAFGLLIAPAPRGWVLEFLIM